nr:hypothetical protein [Tanacetum cinerariifolium]
MAAIINKYLSEKTASNDRLRKSRINILWGMFYRENVDYPELIWEDFAFQIDHKKERKSRCETMPFPDSPKSSSITSSHNTCLSPTLSFNTIIQSRMMEAARKVYATHARIVTESVLEPARRRPSEQKVTYTIQTRKESKKTNRRQPGTGGSNEGTISIPGVPDKSTVVSVTSNYQGDDEEVYWIDSDEDDEMKDDTDDEKSIDLEMTNDEETDDEYVHGYEQVNDNEDEELTNAKVEESRNGDEENTDAEKTDVGKTKDVKNDAEKAELPPTSSSLSVSLVQETPLVAPVTTLPSPSISTIPHVPHKTIAPIPTPPITTDALTITIDVLEFDAVTIIQLRVANWKKKPTIDLEQEYEKSALEIHKIKREQAEKQKMPKPFSWTKPGKKIKRRITKELESSKKPSTTKETPKGIASSKGSKTGRSASVKEPVEELIVEVEMDDAVNTIVKDVVHDANQPHDDSTQAKDKANQPPRTPTLDQE